MIKQSPNSKQPATISPNTALKNLTHDTPTHPPPPPQNSFDPRTFERNYKII